MKPIKAVYQVADFMGGGQGHLNYVTFMYFNNRGKAYVFPWLFGQACITVIGTVRETE